MSVAGVFDMATAAATLVLPIITILGWRYVSRNERRLELTVEARRDMMKLLGQYLDFARDGRDLLGHLQASVPNAIDAAESVARHFADKDSLEHWIELLALRDYEAVLPQAYPIREALIRSHWALHSEVAQVLENPDTRSIEKLCERYDEVGSAVLALRISISNVVTKGLMISTRYQMADVDARFGTDAILLDAYLGRGKVRWIDYFKGRGYRRYVWVLVGASSYPDLWEFPAAVAAPGHGQELSIPRKWLTRVKRYTELSRPSDAGSLSALAPTVIE